jgi:hypothetical protein
MNSHVPDRPQSVPQDDEYFRGQRIELHQVVDPRLNIELQLEELDPEDSELLATARVAGMIIETTVYATD